jgi:glucokinase
MMNDATAFLQGEICDSPSLLQQRVAGITLGTGLGSAWYEDGQLHDGDLYRLPYLSGMAEDYISTRWFMQQYNGTISGVKELAAKYPHEPQVYELFKTFGEHLAAVLLQKFPPGSRDAIIIGGNIANAWSLFIPHTTTVFEQLGVSMNLLPALKGEQAPVLGAASLWKE